MALKLRNRWEYQGDKRWAWTAFIDDEGSGELSEINYVRYFLHPTFSKPVVEVRDPEGGFELRTGGWGVFELAAFAYKKDGGKVRLTHDLEMALEPPQGVSA